MFLRGNIALRPYCVNLPKFAVRLFLFIRPSQSATVSIRLYLSSNCFLHLVGPSFQSFWPNLSYRTPTATSRRVGLENMQLF